MRRCAAAAARRLRGFEGTELLAEQPSTSGSTRQYAVAAQASSSTQQSVSPAVASTLSLEVS